MSAASNKNREVLKTGIIGLGEVAQVSHIIVLNSLSSHYQISYICDVSQQVLKHCSKKVTGGTLPKTTSSPEELIASPDVDVVIICNVNAFHPAHAILALQHNKYAFVEKPPALSYRDLDAINAAEKSSGGRVFVGYQRRYAEAFLDALEEVGNMNKIEYIQIIGPNNAFVSQSGTFPRKWTDFPQQAAANMRAAEEEMVKTALVDEYEVEATPQTMALFRLFTGLGVHDFFALREMGFPVMYESGIIDVPTFDAHLEIYSRGKIVRVNYDTPYVKGLPVTMTTRERIDGAKGDGYLKCTTRKTYEDLFTLEFLEFYHCATKKKCPKTSDVDAREDLDLIRMILQADRT